VSVGFSRNRSHAPQAKNETQDDGASAHFELHLKDVEMGFRAARIRLMTISPSLGTSDALAEKWTKCRLKLLESREAKYGMESLAINNRRVVFL
jgi:hypothetical protein